MSIDWITVMAQMANFLVLVWLLKHFLYRPILNGIDAREEEITRRMLEAKAAQEKAQAAEAEYQKQQAQLLLNQEEMVKQALKTSEKQRDSMLTELRDKLEQEQRDWHKHLELERQNFTSQLYRAGSETLLELTRKVLLDLADETLEEAIVRHVSKRLKPIANELSQAAGDSFEAVASTRGTLPKATQLLLQSEIEHILPSITLHFSVDPQQSPGLILRVGSAQVAWTVDSYTEEFSALLNERLAAGSSGRIQPMVGKNVV
jgi:F-type H+-transporting ATPase subunit b